MKDPQVQHESSPSVIFVLITLMVAVACTFGSVLVMLRVMRWWIGIWS